MFSRLFKMPFVSKFAPTRLVGGFKVEAKPVATPRAEALIAYVESRHAADQTPWNRLYVISAGIERMSEPDTGDFDATGSYVMSVGADAESADFATVCVVTEHGGESSIEELTLRWQAGGWVALRLAA